MRKSVVILLVALFAVTALVSCKNQPEVVGHIITFNANGGSGTMEKQVVVHNTATSLNKNTFSLYRNCFLWWSTAPDGSGTKYNDGGVIKLTSDITLYAQWEYLEDVVLANGVTDWFGGNFYTLTGEVTMSGRINVRGDVVLTLTDGCILNAQKGIAVCDGSRLTIETSGTGTGIINATGTDDNAAIGGNRDVGTGTIIINGGVITASGGDCSAAIGGGQNGNGGTIVINNGTITANGNNDGAGIGGGFQGDGGNITINGGVVNATAGKYSAAIGGGDAGNGGTIVINDGTITANGNNDGAGIGGGNGGDGGEITINDGNITASGGKYSAAIGGGSGGNGGIIIMNGGTVAANGNYNGAGIGGGDNGDGGDITINDGDITVTGGDYASAIGGGQYKNGGTVEINGGVLSATAGTHGAAIGGGYNGDGGDVTINGGSLHLGGGVSWDDPCNGIGHGTGNTDDGTLTLGTDVSLLVSADDESWTAYNCSSDNRARYMKTPDNNT